MGSKIDNVVIGKDKPVRRKISKKQRIILLVVLLIAILLVLTMIFKKDEPIDQSLIDAYETTKKAAVSPSALDSQQVAELEVLLSDEKYAEARQKLSTLQSEKNLTEMDRQLLKTKLTVVCTRLEDIGCLKKTVAEGTDDPFLLLTIARIAKESGDAATAREYYQKTKQFIDGKGGESYVDEVNKNTQETLDYAEISEGAR